MTMMKMKMKMTTKGVMGRGREMIEKAKGSLMSRGILVRQ